MGSQRLITNIHQIYIQIFLSISPMKCSHLTFQFDILIILSLQKRIQNATSHHSMMLMIQANLVYQVSHQNIENLCLWWISEVFMSRSNMRGWKIHFNLKCMKTIRWWCLTLLFCGHIKNNFSCHILERTILPQPVRWHYSTLGLHGSQSFSKSEFFELLTANKFVSQCKNASLKRNHDFQADQDGTVANEVATINK